MLYYSNQTDPLSLIMDTAYEIYGTTRELKGINWDNKRAKVPSQSPKTSFLFAPFTVHDSVFSSPAFAAS